jgi:hypothetical protein
VLLLKVLGEQMVTSVQLSREVLPLAAILTIPAHLLAALRQMLLFTRWGMLSALHTGGQRMYL